MNLKRMLTVFGLSLFTTAMCVAQPLKGYYYGNDSAPTGWEWQSPDSLGYNKLQPHAYFFNFADRETAQRVLPKHSKFDRQEVALPLGQATLGTSTGLLPSGI